MTRSARQRGWRRSAEVLSALLAWLSLPPAPAMAADGTSLWRDRTFSSGYRFVEMSGEELFAGVCQGCHMEDAAGAAGAGAYPSLIGDPRLESSEYPIFLVLNGRRAMPPFADMMSDGQVAAVVNYVRTHFGNDYPDAVTASAVRNVRK